MGRATGNLAPPLKAAIAGVVAAAVAAGAAVGAYGGVHVAQPWRWALVPLCFIGVLLAERFPVKIGPEQKVNLGALPCLVAALLLPPAVGPATVAGGANRGNRLMGRTRWELALNASNLGLAAALASAIGNLGQHVDLASELRAT